MEYAWTAEECQATAVVMAGVSRGGMVGFPHGIGSASLSRATINKMDDVWRDIQMAPRANRGRKRQQRPQPGSGEMAVLHFPHTELGLNSRGNSAIAGATKAIDDAWHEIHGVWDTSGDGKRQVRQNTVGEMTLEDFLSRAGVVRQEMEVAQLSPCASPVTAAPLAVVQPLGMQAFAVQNQQNASWLSYGLQQAKCIRSGSGFSDSMPLMPGPNSSSSPSPSITDSPTGQAKKKDDKHSLLENSLDRRQMRMIKNRESAARSRARKQAYTVELEAGVTHLKEENVRLRKQQALERRLPPPQDPQQPARVLRRTRSAPW